MTLFSSVVVHSTGFQVESARMVRHILEKPQSPSAIYLANNKKCEPEQPNPGRGKNARQPTIHQESLKKNVSPGVHPGATEAHTGVQRPDTFEPPGPYNTAGRHLAYLNSHVQFPRRQSRRRACLLLAKLFGHQSARPR